MQFNVCVCSVTSDSVAPWTVTHQTPLSMEFSRQEYWSGYLPNPGIKPVSPVSADDFFTTAPLASPIMYSKGPFTQGELVPSQDD